MAAVRVGDYYSVESFKRIKDVAEECEESPVLVVDLKSIDVAYDKLAEGFPYAKIFYAVKANPAEEIISLLHSKGSHFDVASVYELRRVLKLGVPGSQISYGNTIKKSKDVRTFYENGVRLFATDSEGDLRNIAKAAPGSRIYVRILTDGASTADWPLSRKFGCQPDMAMDLLILARELGLIPYGVSFHVGSQQREISAWDAAIAKVKVIFDRLRDEDNIHLHLINIGGGLPARYVARTNDLATYTSEITRFLTENFADDMPDIIIEPGRSLVANAGILVSEVVLVARKSRTAVERWVFTDVGMFSGLIETMGECIRYPVYSEKKGELEDVILAGPTCDSADVMYEQHKYPLPLNLAAGDKLYWFSCGAYTASYSSIEFNGFPPLKSIFLPISDATTDTKPLPSRAAGRLQQDSSIH